MNNKIVFANEATIVCTDNDKEIVAEIDNFKYQQHLDAYIATNRIRMHWTGIIYVGNAHGMEFTTTGPKESVKYSRR